MSTLPSRPSADTSGWDFSGIDYESVRESIMGGTWCAINPWYDSDMRGVTSDEPIKEHKSHGHIHNSDRPDGRDD